MGVGRAPNLARNFINYFVRGIGLSVNLNLISIGPSLDLHNIALVKCLLMRVDVYVCICWNGRSMSVCVRNPLMWNWGSANLITQYMV